MTTLDIIKRLPFEFQARLQADDYFSNIPVVVADEGNVRLMVKRQQAILTMKAGKSGAAAVVLQLVADDEFPNLQFGPMTFYPSIQVFELVELNRGPGGTGKTARQIGRRIRDVFKGTALVGLTKVIEVAPPYMVPLSIEDEPGKNVKGFQVGFKCLEDRTEQAGQVALPQIAVANGQATVTCNTPNAVIWITTDDTYPVPNNIEPTSTAQLYAGPVAAPAGTVVRAVAFAPPLIQSWVNRKEC